MEYLGAIESYLPCNEQEAADKEAILQYCALLGDRVLERESPIAHMTSSGLIVNAACDRLLLCHHNILNRWAWTGGHTDGDPDLLAVALREAEEETGAVGLQPLSGNIAGVDILPVPGHRKNGAYVCAHVHLSVAYLLVCPDNTTLAACPGENTAVRWFERKELVSAGFPIEDLRLYEKLLAKARPIIE